VTPTTGRTVQDVDSEVFCQGGVVVKELVFEASPAGLARQSLGSGCASAVPLPIQKSVEDFRYHLNEPALPTRPRVMIMTAESEFSRFHALSAAR
jgi:hypothetical protein